MNRVIRDLIVGTCIGLVVTFVALGAIGLFNFEQKILRYTLVTAFGLMAINIYLEKDYPIGFLRWKEFEIIIRSQVILAVTIGLILTLFCLIHFFVSDRPIPGSNFIKLHESNGIFYSFLVVLVLPYMEEYYIRGNIYRLLKQEYGFNVAVIFSTLLFIFLHGILLVPLVISFATIYVFEKTSSVLLCFLVHSMYNFAWLLAYNLL